MKEKEYSLDDVYFSLSDTQQFKGTKDPEDLMKKSVISNGFLAKKKLPVAMYNTKRAKEQKIKRKLPEETRNDIKVIKMRAALDPKRFYKRNLMKGRIENVQICLSFCISEIEFGILKNTVHSIPARLSRLEDIPGSPWALNRKNNVRFEILDSGWQYPPLLYGIGIEITQICSEMIFVLLNKGSPYLCCLPKVMCVLRTFPEHLFQIKVLQFLMKEVGTVVDSPADFYKSRLPSKLRKNTLVDELLADAKFKKDIKRRYVDIIEQKKFKYKKEYKMQKKRQKSRSRE